MLVRYWDIFLELLRTPFAHADTVWGIVPLYFGWVLNEVTSAKASYHTATQTGFTFLWAGAHWTWQYLTVEAGRSSRLTITTLFAVNVIVTLLVLGVGALALVSGLRRRFPKYGSFLGYTRFGAYFMIAIFPIQSNYLAWSWDRLVSILLFAPPTWLLFDLGLRPVRGRMK